MLELGRIWPALSLLALATGACSGGYPLEPTLCDDFCNVTQGSIPYCSDYDPAQCVVQCEAGDLTRAACRGELDALLDCVRREPTAISDQCSYSPGPRACQGETATLLFCIDFTNGTSFGPLE